MKAINFSEFKQNLDLHVKAVCSKRETILVTSEDGNNLAVLPIEEFNSLMETHYLLASEANVIHLEKSLRQIRDGATVIKTIKDIERMVKK